MYQFRNINMLGYLNIRTKILLLHIPCKFSIIHVYIHIHIHVHMHIPMSRSQRKSIKSTFRMFLNLFIILNLFIKAD